MNDFTEKYTSYPNKDLLRIIENPGEYQLYAVETAKSILAERQLSHEEINNLKDELIIEVQEKLLNKSPLEGKFEKLGASLIESLGSVQNDTTDRTIKSISIVFGAIFLIHLFSEYEMISFMLTDTGGFDFSTILYFLPLIAVPTSSVFFYKRKKIGWLFLTVYMTYSGISALGLFILTINLKPSDLTFLDSILSPISPTRQMLTFVFHTGTIWAICKKSIRNIYSINDKSMILTISLTALFVVIALNLLY